MNDRLSAPGRARIHPAIDALVAEYGAGPVLLRALRALLLPPARAPAPRIDLLDARMRRDIGLPPLPRVPRDWQDLR